MAGLLDDLNPRQREAVCHGSGPLLVLAGAGSGKTRVLTTRVAHLLATGLAGPGEVTAVSFTNTAAGEMRERVAALLDGAPAVGFVGTFHRWALGVLRRHPRDAGLPSGFAILDRDDQQQLVGRAMKELGVDPKAFPARSILGRISAVVNRGEGPDAVSGDDRPFEQVTARVWERYRKLKSAAGAVDFDDMLVLALEVLRREEAVLREVRRRARWLLVDEFQDTNRLQLELLRLVLGDDANLTAVGDEDQSIYRWRGAALENILAFERHFPGASVVKLEENYRSTAPILAAAGALIANNRGRRGKTLFTSRPGGEPVRLFIAEDERAEARWVADRFEELAGREELAEMAVLVRTNAQTRAFEEELTRRRVPHRVIGGLRFWQRAEVKDALAYLRLLERPDDVMAFRRVVNVPARGIGAATLDVLDAHASATGRALPEAARDLPEGLTPRARQSLGAFFELLEEARANREQLEPGDLVGWLLEATGLLSLYGGDDEERVARRENLQQLASAVAEAASAGQDLAAFLDAVALLEEGDDGATPDAVSLMTLHAAKGLEFAVVALAGLEDGLLPHASAREEPEALEEERRLAYVGMTRARRWLGLTAARTRFLFGQRHPTRPSPFLDELPRDEIHDVSDSSFPSTPGGGETRPAGRTGVALRRVPSRTAGARSRVPTTATDADGTGWRPGDRVRHRRFGTGVVLACQGTGPKLKLVVYFDRGGRKTLVPTIARLEKA